MTVRGIGRGLFGDEVLHCWNDIGIDPATQPSLLIPLCGKPVRFVREALETDPHRCEGCEDAAKEIVST